MSYGCDHCWFDWLPPEFMYTCMANFVGKPCQLRTDATIRYHSNLFFLIFLWPLSEKEKTFIQCPVSPMCLTHGCVLSISMSIPGQVLNPLTQLYKNLLLLSNNLEITRARERREVPCLGASASPISTKICNCSFPLLKPHKWYRWPSPFPFRSVVNPLSCKNNPHFFTKNKFDGYFYMNAF